MSLETAVRVEYGRLPYAGYCACMNCGERGYCRGKSASTRICLICFEFVYDLHAPSRPPVDERTNQEQDAAVRSDR